MRAPKLLSLSLALALMASVSLPVRAELLKNLKTDGSIEVKTFGIDNEVDLRGTTDDYRSEARTRLMLGGSFDLLDDVHARVLLGKNNRVYGGTAGTSESVQTVESNVFVDNAYVKIDKVFGRVDLTMGRQFYNDPNDLVIYFGPQPDDLLTITALDIFRADADLGGVARFKGIAGKLADTGAAGAGANSDTDVYGGEVNTDRVVPMGNLAAYYYTQKVKNAASTLGNNTLNIAGIRAGGDILAGLGYRAEFVQNFGRNNSIATTPAYHGSAYLVGVHYGHELMNYPFRARLEYGRGSADFATIAPGVRYGIIWGEHTNFGPGQAGLTNLKVFDGGLGISPISRLGIDVNAYRFMLDRATATGKSSAGTEYDLILSWRHSDNVTLEANAASFQVGDANQNVGSATSPITRLGADVKIKF